MHRGGGGRSGGQQRAAREGDLRSQERGSEAALQGSKVKHDNISVLGRKLAALR